MIGLWNQGCVRVEQFQLVFRRCSALACRACTLKVDPIWSIMAGGRCRRAVYRSNGGKLHFLSCSFSSHRVSPDHVLGLPKAVKNEHTWGSCCGVCVSDRAVAKALRKPQS